MKYIKLIPFLMAVALLTVTGCKKKSADDTTPAASAATPASLTAQVNDVNYTATHIYATILGNRITINGSRGRPDIVLSFPAARGSYKTDTVNTTSAFASYSSDSSNSSLSYRGLPGIITITSINTITQMVSGSFNFIGIAPSGLSVTVSTGSFNDVHYANITYTSSFSAYVDTVPYQHLFAPAGITATKITSGGKTQYFITGTATKNEAISLTLPASVTSGSHKIDSVSYFAAYTDTANHHYYARPVSFSNCTITKFDSIAHIIKGTFQFDATYKKDSVTFFNKRTTLGKFAIQYQ